MNYKKLQNHIDTFSENVTKSVPCVEDDNKNINDFFCADVVGNKRFAQNYGGYPRSEIAEINAQTNVAVARNLLQDLEDYSTNYNDNAGLSDAQIMLGHKSKYMQCPSEQTSYLESLIRERENVRYAKAMESLKAEQAKNYPKKVDVKQTDNE